jgi:FtsH-binding integral membrane protein
MNIVLGLLAAVVFSGLIFLAVQKLRNKSVSLPGFLGGKNPGDHSHNDIP